MRNLSLAGLTALALVLPGLTSAQQTASTPQAAAPENLGLRKQSVFEESTPQPFSYDQGFPGRNAPIPAAFPGAPPQIPHDIAPFEPVTLRRNMCVRCHDKPEHGKKAPGMATPIPLSHYRDMREAPDKVKQRLDGTRYICTQCHAPQANVKPLVGNSFASQTQK